jgi:hypothetical protein
MLENFSYYGYQIKQSQFLKQFLLKDFEENLVHFEEIRVYLIPKYFARKAVLKKMDIPKLPF